MKHILITIATVLLVGCAVTQSQNSAELHSAGDNANGRKEHVPEQKTEPPSISIHKAASIGDIEAVRQHLAAGTDPNLMTPVVTTPLFHGGSNMEMMTLLVENGADVNDLWRGRRMTALHWFTDPERVRFFIDKVADVNAIDEFGDTPLHKVVEGHMWRKKESVEILIAAGAEVNAINFDGLTPLDSLLSKSHYTKSNKVKLEFLGLLRKHGAKTSLELRPLDKKEDDENNSGLDILLMDWIFD
jgi:ankyrin repeat protein